MSVLLSVLIVLNSGATLPQASALTPVKSSYRVMKQVEMQYLVYLPEDYATTGRKRYPLILFLHGSGERGHDVDKVKTHGPPKLISAGQKFPFIVVSPQCPDGQFWDPDILTALLNDLEKHYRVDKDREYLTGLSMGGRGTWELASATPSRFAAIAPICGWFDATAAPKLKNVPIWATHGDADPAVNIAWETPLIDALKTEGADVKYTIVPGGLHDVWTDVYASPAIYDWFLAHKRKR